MSPLLLKLIASLPPVIRPRPKRRAVRPAPPKYVHIACQVYHLPPVGKDSHVDELIVRGQLVLTGEDVIKGAEVWRMGRDKGTTYRKYPPGAKRKEHRDREFNRVKFFYGFPNRPLIPLREAVFS